MWHAGRYPKGYVVAGGRVVVHTVEQTSQRWRHTFATLLRQQGRRAFAGSASARLTHWRSAIATKSSSRAPAAILLPVEHQANGSLLESSAPVERTKVAAAMYLGDSPIFPRLGGAESPYTRHLIPRSSYPPAARSENTIREMENCVCLQ